MGTSNSQIFSISQLYHQQELIWGVILLDAIWMDGWINKWAKPLLHWVVAAQRTWKAWWREHRPSISGLDVSKFHDEGDSSKIVADMRAICQALDSLVSKEETELLPVQRRSIWTLACNGSKGPVTWLWKESCLSLEYRERDTLDIQVKRPDQKNQYTQTTLVNFSDFPSFWNNDEEMLHNLANGKSLVAIRYLQNISGCVYNKMPELNTQYRLHLVSNSILSAEFLHWLRSA